MHELAELLKAVAWPGVALTALLLLRSEARALISVMAAKIDRVTRIKAGKVMIDLAEEIARGTITQSRSGSIGEGANASREFEQLTEEYDHLTITDYAERVAARRRLADRLGELAAALKLSRGALSESRSEGKLVALVTAAVLKPMANDLAALERAAETAEFNYTRYRIVLALVPTLSRPDVGAGTLRRVEKVLGATEHREHALTGPTLQRLIDSVRATVASLNEGLS